MRYLQRFFILVAIAAFALAVTANHGADQPIHSRTQLVSNPPTCC
jgi:hypothetical protein